MKNKVLTGIVIAGLFYLIYFLAKFLMGPPNNAFKFRTKYLYYGAEWFESKGVKKIVSTNQIGKHNFVFEKYNIEVIREEYKEISDTENFQEPPPIDEKKPEKMDYINLIKFVNLANKTNSKGLYVQGMFAANDKNIKMFEDFIANKGYIYFNSPTDFDNLSESFITFMKKNVSAGSICVLDFTKMITKPGTSILDNLDNVIQYNESNTDLLIKKLKKQFELQQQYHKKEKEALESPETP